MTTLMSVKEASQNLEVIIQEAAQRGRSFLLTKNKKPVAALIGTSWFLRMIRLVEKYDPGLADTIAISVNPEIQTLLEKSENDSIKGKVVSFDESLVR